MVARVSTRVLAAIAVVGLAAACEQTSPLAPFNETPVLAAALLPTSPLPNQVWICKDAAAGNFDFTVSLSNIQAPALGFPVATVHQPNPTIAAGTCLMVASGGGALATITEVDPSPYKLDMVEVYQVPLAAPSAPALIGTSFTYANTEMYGDRGLIFVYYNVAPTLCTLTLGYWKTHNASFTGGAPVDPTWALLPGGLAEGTKFFSSGKTWFEVFWTPVGGNAYYNLAHQYMAARLNVMAGASTTTAVDAALAGATTLFNTYGPSAIASLKGNDALRKQFINLAGTLGAYNEGLIGPGHCSKVPVDIP